MTDVYGSYQRMGWMGCQNQGSAIIPAFSPVQVLDGFSQFAENVWKVDQIGSSANPGFNPRITFTREFQTPAGGSSSTGFGTCTLTMPCWAAYDTGTPSPGDVYGIKPGQFTLTKGGVGVFRVWRVNTADKRVYGVWEGIQTVLGKVPTGTLAKNSSGTLNLWTGTPGSETVTSGPWTVTVYNRRAQIGTNAFVIATLIDGSWYVLDDNTAYILEGTLGGTLSTTTSTITVGSLSVVTPGALPVASTITANNDFKLTGASGAKCLVIGDGNTWVLVETIPIATILEGTLGGTLTNSTSSVTVGSLTAVSPGSTPGSSVTANNDFGLAGALGAKCLVTGNGTTWVLTQVAHIVVTPLMDLQASDPNYQVETRDIVVMPNAAQSGWINKITGADC